MIYKLTGPAARSAAIKAISVAPEGWTVRITHASRTLDQNAALWPRLTDIADQVVWHGQKLTSWDWKDVFTAALKRAKVVPGLDGGFVVCGLSSSQMGKAEFSELIDLINAFGDEHKVKWSQRDLSK